MWGRSWQALSANDFGECESLSQGAMLLASWHSDGAIQELCKLLAGLPLAGHQQELRLKLIPSRAISPISTHQQRRQGCLHGAQMEAPCLVALFQRLRGINLFLCPAALARGTTSSGEASTDRTHESGRYSAQSLQVLEHIMQALSSWPRCPVFARLRLSPT